MSNSRSHTIKVLLLFVTFLFGSSMPLKSSCEDYYAIAIRMMHAFYQELQGKDVSVQVGAIQPFDSERPPSMFNIAVSEVHPDEPITAAPSPAALSSAERVGHLSIHFEFDPRDRNIVMLFASGSFVNSEKHERLAKLINGHPAWSETEMADALVAAGAKFGPSQKDILLARFPKNGLESIFGKIEIRSTEFEFRGNGESSSNARMEWSVRFRASKNEKDEYFVSMEPFDGKVVAFGRTPFRNENK